MVGLSELRTLAATGFASVRSVALGSLLTAKTKMKPLGFGIPATNLINSKKHKELHYGTT